MHKRLLCRKELVERAHLFRWFDFVKTRSARDHMKTALKKNSRGLFNLDLSNLRKK